MGHRFYRHHSIGEQIEAERMEPRRRLNLRALGAFYMPVHLQDGWVYTFDVTTCDRCGGDVLAGGTVKLKASEEALRRAGLRRVESWPAHEQVEESTGEAVCEACAVD